MQYTAFKAQQQQNFLHWEKSYLFIYLGPVMPQHVWLLSLSPRLNELQKFIEYWSAGKVKHDI